MIYSDDFDGLMSKTYGDRYGYLKHKYPNVSSLPAAEIKKMVDLIDYAPNMEQAEEAIDYHIQHNEPVWNRSYLKKQEEKRTNPYLRFDGKNLSWYENEENKGSWAGLSGDPEYQCKNLQNLRDGGPLPEGRYKVNQNRLQHFDDLPWYERAISSLSNMGKWPGGRIAWGNHRVWIEPEEGTNTYGRNNFSIHGGTSLGSKGCIDLTNQMNDFTKAFQNHNQDMDLIVEYPEGCWIEK